MGHGRQAFDPEEIAHRMGYRKPDERRARLHDRVRMAITNTAYDIGEVLDEGPRSSRELSTAMAKLEEALFWVNAHIARNVLDETVEERAKATSHTVPLPDGTQQMADHEYSANRAPMDSDEQVCTVCGLSRAAHP